MNPDNCRSHFTPSPNRGPLPGRDASLVGSSHSFRDGPRYDSGRYRPCRSSVPPNQRLGMRSKKCTKRDPHAAYRNRLFEDNPTDDTSQPIPGRRDQQQDNTVRAAPQGAPVGHSALSDKGSMGSVQDCDRVGRGLAVEETAGCEHLGRHPKAPRRSPHASVSPHEVCTSPPVRKYLRPPH
jgi:hypothetical protein